MMAHLLSCGLKMWRSWNNHFIVKLNFNTLDKFPTWTQRKRLKINVGKESVLRSDSSVETVDISTEIFSRWQKINVCKIIISPSVVADRVSAAEPVKVDSSVPLIEDCDSDAALDNKELRKQLCPYAAVGECRYGINCAYLHGDVCDMCGLQVLHPTDNAQRSEHTKVTLTANSCWWVDHTSAHIHWPTVAHSLE